VKRRVLLQAGSLVVAGPWAAIAQPAALPVIGYLSGVARAEGEERLAFFRRGLAQAGYREDQHVRILYRWADGDYERLPALAAGLVREPVTVLVASGGPRAALAAKAATSNLPIVFTMGGDPVTMGLVASLNRPGGNVTGVSFRTVDLTPKRFELLRELVPKSRLVALVVNPGTPSTPEQIRGAQEAATAAGLRLHVERVRTEAEIDTAFAALARLRPDALLIGTDAFLGARQPQLVQAAARLALPTIYEGSNAVAAGGLISYGPSINATYVQLGEYTARVLAGAKPATLPILQPITFELVINLKTARALGLTVPQALLIRADEVIQ
jgi:putative tryptophan/tyrosine transport system substrate-binding protein